MRHARTIAVANQKGGVGKTTTAVNIAVAVAQVGVRVLLVDADPQGNASTALGLDHRAETPGTYEVLVDSQPIIQCVQQTSTPGLAALVASTDLAGAQVELVSKVRREFRLREAVLEYLASEEQPVLVLIDCPPGLDLLTVNALVSADEVLVPMQCEYYSMEGISQLEATTAQVRTYLNPDLHPGSILLTMHEEGELADEVLAEVTTHFPDRVFRTVIPRAPELSIAPSHGQSVLTHRPFSRGAQAYQVAATELLERLAGKNDAEFLASRAPASRRLAAALDDVGTASGPAVDLRDPQSEPVL